MSPLFKNKYHSTQGKKKTNIYGALVLLLLVHGQVTIIFVVSVCLFVCLFVCLSVCLFVQSFSQPSSIRFGSN